LALTCYPDVFQLWHVWVSPQRTQRIAEGKLQVVHHPFDAVLDVEDIEVDAETDPLRPSASSAVRIT